MKKYRIEIKCFGCNKIYVTNMKSKKNVPVRCKFCGSTRLIPLKIFEMDGEMI